MGFHAGVSEDGPLTAGAPADVAPPPLHVLRVGAPASRVPDGVVERAWRSVDVELPAAAAPRPMEALADGTARIDTAPIAWADVVLLALPLTTVPVCLDCGATGPDGDEPLAHALETGHAWRRASDRLVRGLVLAGARDPGLWLARGLVVELRGDPVAEVPAVERDLVRLLLARADGVIAATQVAAAAARREGVAEGRLTLATDGSAGDAARVTALRRAAAAQDPDRLDRRRALRAADAIQSERLAARRARGLPAWDPDAPDDEDPLVSIVIPVADEPQAVVERAIASALACGDVRLEVVVAGAAGSAAARPADGGDDGRVRRIVVGEGSPAAVLAAGLDAAAGAWIAPLDPWATPVPEGPATLLAVAREYGLDAVYAQAIQVSAGAPVGVVGAWPATRTTFVPDALLFSAGLRGFRPDPDAAADGDGAWWNLWRRWSEAGARLASIDEPLALCEVPGPGPAGGGSAA